MNNPPPPELAQSEVVPVVPVPLEQLLAELPPPLEVGPSTELVRAGRRVVILDDDPTGTQTIADLPVLTQWTVDDLRWALRQPTTGFFVLTNTRSLAAADAASRNRQVVTALVEAARIEGVEFTLLSRSDSTMRGYFPLETDVLAVELAKVGITIDGVLICPAYIEPGRITIDSVHWARVAAGMIPVATSEFARDASFGYRSSDLRDWVAEKTAGSISADQVAAITISDIRLGGPARVLEILSSLRDRQPVVVDATCDADLQVVLLALLQAEAAGQRFIYRTGPAFVRTRTGQTSTPAISSARLREIIENSHSGAGSDDSGASERRLNSARGLIVVGSHVGLTTRQLDKLRSRGSIVELELDVPSLLDPTRRATHLAQVVSEAVGLLRSDSDRGADSGFGDLAQPDPDLRDQEPLADVVLRTSRKLVKGSDAVSSLEIARAVSSALVGTVAAIVSQVRPAFVVAKGGITSSDTATDGLGIRWAWCRGTLLPGIVSLWEPVAGPAQGVPYVVFAGNVGDDRALAAVVDTLRLGTARPSLVDPQDSAPVGRLGETADQAHRIAVIGLGAMGLQMASRLAEKFAITGFDPFAQQLERAAAAGVVPAGSPGLASAEADIVLLAVRDLAQTEAALFGPDGVCATLRPGGLVILTSTIGPDAARDLAARLDSTGHRLVDAPISGGPVRAGLGDLLIVVGAEADALDEARAVLEQLASTLTVVGPHPGDGQSLKVINQLLAGVHIAAAAEAIALARSLGLDPELVIGALSTGAASSFMFADRAPRMLQAYNGGAEVKSRVDIFVKDMGIVTAVGRTAHVPLPVAAAAQQLYLLAEAAGLGAADDSSVVTLLSPPTS